MQFSDTDKKLLKHLINDKGKSKEEALGILENTKNKLKESNPKMYELNQTQAMARDLQAKGFSDEQIAEKLSQPQSLKEGAWESAKTFGKKSLKTIGNLGLTGVGAVTGQGMGYLPQNDLQKRSGMPKIQFQDDFLQTAVEGAKEGFEEGQQLHGETLYQTGIAENDESTRVDNIQRGAANMLGATNSVMKAVTGAAEGALGDVVEPVIQGGLNDLSEENQMKLSQISNEIAERYDSLSDDEKLLLKNIAPSAELLFDVGTAGASGKLAKTTGKKVDDLGQAVRQMNLQDVDLDLSKKIDDFSQNISDRKINNTKEIVGDLDANKEKLAEEFTEKVYSPEVLPVAEFDEMYDARDLIKDYASYTLGFRRDGKNTLSPLGRLATKVNDEVIPKVQTHLKDVGEDIGKIRNKLKTYEVRPDETQGILDKMESLMDSKYGVKFTDKGIVQELSDRITSLSKSEKSTLTELRKNLISLKETRNPEKLIDLRQKVDKDIRWLKSNLENKADLDPVNKLIRTELAKINERLIGKEQAQKLADYSDLKSIIDDYSKLSSKGKNPEFLLKRMMSERDRLPKELIQRLNEVTGVDLYKEKKALDIALRYLGTDDAVGLLQQEIKKAGVDVATLGDIALGGKLSMVKAGKGALEWVNHFLSDPGKLERVLKKVSKDEKMWARMRKYLKDEGVNPDDIIPSSSPE